MRITFDYKGIEIIAMGDEKELTRFVNRLVGNEPKKEPEKEPEKKPRKPYKFNPIPCAVCGCDFVPLYGAQKRCAECREKGLKIPKGEKKPESEGARIYLTGATVFKTEMKKNEKVKFSFEE